MRACGLAHVPIRVKYRRSRDTVHVRMLGQFDDGEPFYINACAKSNRAPNEDMKSYLRRAGIEAFIVELLNVPPAKSIIERYTEYGPKRITPPYAYL